MTPRLLLATLPLLIIGCSHPKAIVVEEPQSKPAQSSASTNDLPSTEITLRDPDVVSELPDESSTGTVNRTPPAGSGSGSGTVIARPPGGE